VTELGGRSVLVTGGGGFLGSHVVRALQGVGAQVRVLLAPNEGQSNLADVECERVRGDLLDPASLGAAMAGCDVVFHLAAIYAIWLPDKELIWRVNIQGSLHIVEAAARAGVERLVHTSSIAAVGSAAPGSPADETTLFDRWTEADPYVWSKYVSELEVLRRARELGVDTVVVNPAFLFGPGDVAPTPTGQIVQMLLAGFPFWFEGGFNAADVRDVARGHLLAAERGRSFERYILAGHNVRYADFTDRVCALANVRRPPLRAPRAAMLLAGKVADALADLTGKAPPFAHGAIQYAAERELYFDTARAESELGYTKRPLDESVADSIAWFRSPEFKARP
jgi:dihydroflavonol-4-reductase